MCVCVCFVCLERASATFSHTQTHTQAWDILICYKGEAKSHAQLLFDCNYRQSTNWEYLEHFRSMLLLVFA